MLTTRINGFIFTFYQWPEDVYYGVWRYVVVEERLFFGAGISLEKCMAAAWRHAYMR